ncbi:kinetochore scaffold 1 [Gavia stellata]|uniref:kinetochore scaffold 1 n=1 Tax=Gavia stellata TaxID=37040 RepID=UPI0028A1D617|nr:kinetochore scaffold 1 [Gavia stellata]
MDKTYADPNMENDNTEHIRGKRLSSILKAPRNPLDDLGNGNELTQDINVEKRRKNSRRVSFANTINCRVFQRDLKNNTAETESTECAADTRNDVLLNQNEEPEAVPCEITGMNTLLHAPIQALVQQTEWHDADNAIQRTNRHDTTLIFSDENEMDMTASHTAVITRNLKNSQADKTEKIDITSFLAGLNSNNGKAEISKGFHFFSDPTKHSCPSFEQKEDATTVKKIDFNEFLMSLKSSKKALNPIEGPEKENVFFVPSQVSEDRARSSVEFVYSHEPLDTCNVTKVFRGQDDGMEMTKCQASDVKAMFSGIHEAPPEQLLCADVTEAFVDDGMDMTTSHTAKMSFPFSSVGNQSLNFKKDFPSTELDNSILKRASNQHLIVQQDTQLCTDKKIVSVEDRRDPPVLRTVKQEARTMSAIPGSVSSETVFRGDKTVVFSKCDDMEITGNYTDVICNDSSKEMNSSCHKTFEKPVNTNSLLAENRCPAHGDRDITKSLTSSDNRASVSYKNSALELSSGSDEQIKKVIQGHGTASGNVGFDSCTNSASTGVSKSRLQHRLANSQLTSLPDEKTVIFSGEDMDLTKTCVVKDDGKNVDNESPAGVFTSVTCKPHFLDNRSTSPKSNEQEEMEITKCHAVVIDDQSNGITAEAKQMHCKIIPRKNQIKNVSEGAHSLDMDKENLEVISINGDIKRSQAIEMNTKDLEVIMVDKKLGKTNFQASGPSSCAKSVCLLQQQKREVPENIVTDTCAFVSLKSQKVVVSQPLEKNLLNASVSCTNDKMGMFSDDQNMDITKTHPAAFDVAPINTVQEYKNNHNQNNVLPKQLENQTFQLSGSSGIDIASQTAAIECGDLKMNTHKQIVTPLAPNGSCISSNEPAPSGMKGNEHLGTILGINADCRNSDRQEKTHTMKVVNKVLPTRIDAERDFSIGKTGSSEEDFKNPHSVDGLHLGGAEEPLVANTSEPHKGSSQLTPFLEKSVVFPSGENMDLTGICAVMVPDHNINAVSSERKELPGYLVQDENKIMSLKKGVMMTINSQEQPACDVKTVVFTLAEDMEITKTHTAVLSGEIDVQDRESIPAISAAPADKTIVFTHNQDDMEITASHTIAVNNNINGFENQEVSHKSTQQPDLHSALLSSCRDEIDSSHTKDLNGEYHTKSKDEPSVPSSASSASAFPSEKGAMKASSGTTPDSIYSASLPEESMDVQAPQDLDLPMDNSVPINRQQDLTPPEKLKSKRVSFKLPSNGPMDCSEESGDLVSCVSLPIQQPDSLTGSLDARSTGRNQVSKDDLSRHEDLATDLGLAGASLVPVSNKESKENEGLSAEGETPPKDFQTNSEQAKQLLASDSPRDQIDPTLAPELSGILNVCSKLKNIRRKSAVLSISETAFSDQLLKSSTQPEDTLRLGKNTNNSFYTKEQENTCVESGAAPIDANLDMAFKDKYQGINVPLGIFQPRLPNRRNPSVSSVQDINAKRSDKGEAPVSEVSINAGETPGNKKSNRQNFSPSQFIAEEFLPVCLEEMDSNESVSSEFVENACNEISKKQISHNEKNQFEETKTCNNTKRALGQHEEDLQSPKKLKRDENLDGEASQDLQVTFGAVSQSQVEVHEGEDPPNLSAKSPDGTHASTSSSLDSVKADTELTIQRSSQMESQLLTDSICEDNLREKFQNGVITVGEFFTLLQVHVPIQKPRRSHLPASCAVSAPPTPEDLLYSQYIYRPKLRIYEEDCQALSQMIDELKPYANVQDQLLVNVNKSLWEVMRTCSDEELKSFGAELNKMKSYFTKESKILAHNEKVTLYGKLLQSAQEQHGKLQSRMEKVDELLKEAESCLVALEADSDWEEWGADCSGEMAEGKNLEKELESIKAEEEELQRELSDLETQNEQMLAQMNQLKEKETSCQELLERYDFTEWEITEWSEQQAVFNFLYDSVELTVVFGPPIDGDVFGEDPSRRIVSLNFESLLDEEKAPPSSRLVRKLIFQFIESQGCWQEKCPTLHYLPQVLHEVSLVVSRCKTLGEEIEFLERWGGKFNLLKTDINDTKVKLLFSASTAFAKFELTLSLSANYPSASLPFTVQKQIGNIGEEEISAVLSNVPIGYHYLRRIVSLIHQNLLQDPR